MLQELDNDWFFVLVFNGDEREPAVYENTCYICGKVWEDTEGSEVCSDECLALEEQMPMYGEPTCQNESCTLKATHTIPCRSGQ